MNVKNITRLVLGLAFGLLFSVAAWAQDAFFSEDFAGGVPSGWTRPVLIGNNQPSSAWRHTTTGAAGPFSIAPLNSTTAGNGWMIFDSDLNCNHPTGQDAWLISPAIDGTDYESIWLQFETFYRSFNDIPQIRVGTDLGNLDSWAVIEVFPGIRANDFGGIIVEDEGLNPQIINLDLTPHAAGVNGFHFAFQFLSIPGTDNGGDLTGCGYSWHVDDVRLLDANPTFRHNLSVSRPRLAPNFAQPESQIDTVRMAARITNFGLERQTNVALTATIQGDNGDSFTTTEVAPELQPDSIVFFFLDETFVPSGLGNYVLTYSVEADSADQQPENNIIGADFIITEDLFSKDDGRIAFRTGPATIDGETWEVGNYYYVPNGGYQAHQAEFSIFAENNAHHGRSVNVLLYEVDEDENPVFSDDDVNVVGFATHTFTNEPNDALITVNLLDLITGETGVELKARGEYLLMIQYEPGMLGVFSNMPTDYDVATVVKDGTSWFLGGFSGGGVVVARMRIRSGETSVGQVPIARADIDLFPSPAADIVNASIVLEAPSRRMEVRVLNTMGQPVHRQVFDNTMGETLRFDVRQYPAGTYFFQIVTDEGVKTQRFAVQR